MISVVLVLVGVISWGVSGLLVSGYSPVHIRDVPNARSLHTRPIPRTGGIAMLVALAFGWGALYYLGYRPEILRWIVPATFLVAAISLLDDRVTLSPLPRLAVHGVAAALLITGGLVLPWGVAGILLTWLAVVWMQNLYNFMDGMDGFAPGMALSGFSFLGLAGALQGDWQYAFYCWVVAGASAGFLVLNFPPARLFMGDAGSIPLGLLAAAVSLWGIREGLFPLWVPILIFSPFIVDATVTILRRLFRGEKLWEAHCSHYYQRLVLAGWSHRRTVLFEYLLMICCGATAILATQAAEMNPWIVPGVWGGVYLAIMAWIGRMEDARQ